MRILFIGDIVGRIGRKTIAKIVPELIQKEKIDLTIANGENLAHGKG
ncbi:MAG: YmdB family metallophosphoesterase, partial [Patescibacteria group bacterium]|nr:YmdB family metallophosphoesterase [Patescibacteria group bacterium]